MNIEEKNNGEVLVELAEIVDLEVYAKQGKKPERAKQYRIKVDKDYYIVDVGHMTGREILVLAKKTPPENYLLHQKYKGGKTQKIELTDVVDFMEPGVEKFQTLPLDATEG